MDRQRIAERIVADDRWLARGILAIYAKQTDEEQHAETTIEDNGVGFNGVDAPFMTSIAKQLQQGRTLSPHQAAVCRKIMIKYCGQLERIAGGVHV